MTGMQTTIKFMAIYALIVGVFIVGVARAGLVADEVQPGSAKIGDNGKKIETVSDRELAFRYLFAREVLYGELATIYRDLNELRREGQKLNISIEYVMHNPDGTANQVVLNGLDDLERLFDIVDRAKEVYERKIRTRPKGQIMTNYKAVVSDFCPVEWIKSGEVIIEKNDLSFLLRQGEKAFEGVVVGDSVTVVFPGGALAPLVGGFKDRQHVKLEDIHSSCVVRLFPNKDLALN